MGRPPRQPLTPDLILASGSPRRRRLLARAGYAFDVVVPGLPEDELVGEPPDLMVRRLAVQKHHEVEARVDPNHVILAADTTVAIDDHVLGKPSSVEDAAAMLRLLAGRTHDVLTGWAVGRPGNVDVHLDITKVTFRPLSEHEIVGYAASGEAVDKAGAYAYQGAGRGLVASIRGASSNVIGLPIERVIRALDARGVRPRRGRRPVGPGAG